MLPASGSSYDLILEALKTRGGIMFEGKNGAAIRSGVKSDAANAERPTYGLCRAAIYVVFNVLPGGLFDPLAQHRPCGMLDRYEAVGMLIGDALGLPLIPARPQGLAVGKRARKLEQTIPAETDKQKKADKRRGEDGSGAAATVLCREVKLPLPTAQECLASAPAEPKVTPDPAPSMTAPPPTAPPPTVPPPTAPPPTAPAVARTADGRVLRLQGSRLAEVAVLAAIGCEVAQTWLREGIDEPIGVRPGWEAYDAAALEKAPGSPVGHLPGRADCDQGAVPDEGVLRLLRDRRVQARHPVRVRGKAGTLAVDHSPPHGEPVLRVPSRPAV